MQIFSYIIYFALFFVVFILPFQELFWLGLYKYRQTIIPIVILIIVNNTVRDLMMKNLELAKPQYRGIPHPRLYSMFDTLNTLLSCVVGWAPAIVRIVASFISTLIILPRLDLKLPGAALDGSWKKFQGAMESWRLQTEYRIVAQYRKEQRMKDVVHMKNPSFNLSEEKINVEMTSRISL